MNDDKFQITADPSKYVTLPVQNEEIWNKYQNTLEWFWTVYDISLNYDREDMFKIYDEEKRECILKLIAFMFASHHTTINKELFMQFMSQVEIKEASYYFGSQADAKKTHLLMYSMLLDELTQSDKANKDKLTREVLSMPHVRNFIHWSIKSTSCSSKSFAYRLFAFATLQGIVFEGPLLLVKWLEKQNPTKMQGFNTSNNLIWRDEMLNLSFSCMLFKYIDDELNQEDAYQLVQEAVAHAKNILTESMQVSKLGVPDELIEQYIEYSADKLLSDVGLLKLYKKKCPFDWFQEPTINLLPKKNSKVDRFTKDLDAAGLQDVSFQSDF